MLLWESVLLAEGVVALALEAQEPSPFIALPTELVVFLKFRPNLNLVKFCRFGVE